jgi:hypothetical protein
MTLIEASNGLLRSLRRKQQFPSGVTETLCLPKIVCKETFYFLVLLYLENKIKLGFIRLPQSQNNCKRAYGLGSQCRPNECLFGSGKPQGVGISGRGPDGQAREIQGSVYEQPKEEVDGSCHSKEGSK